MVIQRKFMIALLVALVLAGSVAVASAHVDVKSTSPARGKTAKATIDHATVTFTAALRRGTLGVTGPGGKVVSIGKGGRDPRRITRLLVGLKDGLTAGSYKASWTIVAADGHHQRGSFTFRLKR